MTTKSLKALSYIISVAANELPIIKWIAMLTTMYPNGIPEETTMATVINYYAEHFPNFETRAEDDSQDGYDKLYEDFLKFIESNNG